MAHRATRTTRARLAIPAAAVAIGLVTAGCAPSSDDSGAEAEAGTVVSADTLDQLRAELEEAQAVPEFEPQGPAFSVAPLAGKKILSMPVSSQLQG